MELLISQISVHFIILPLWLLNKRPISLWSHPTLLVFPPYQEDAILNWDDYSP